MRNEEVLQRMKAERNIKQTIRRSKTNWIGHMLHRNFLPQHVIVGKVEGRTEVTGKYEIGRGSTRSHCVENLLWKRLRTVCETDNKMNEFQDCCVSICKPLCSEFPEDGALQLRHV